MFDAPSDATASPAFVGAARLTDWGVIRAAGADALKFLHSQLTQDFELLKPDEARLAGYCSAKGRLMATFVAWRDHPNKPDDVLLACSADVLPGVMKRLGMFVLRAKCKLSDVSAEVPLWGVADGAPPGPVWGVTERGGGHVIRLPNAQVAGQIVPRHLQAGGTVPELPEMSLATWNGLEAASGVARVVAATAEQFVPQMVNLELVGGVNFKKGCYPGQEVVARSQYRGTLKRRAQVLQGSTPLVPGQELFHSADPGQPAGMVVNAGQLPGIGPIALAELKLTALEGGELHLGSAEGPALALGQLPYPVPTQTD